jgi:putative ABC transport system permease protein
MLYAKTKTAASIPELVKKIDAEYASSEFPVRTQTEAAFAQMFSDMMGNVQGFIQSIGIAVVFSLSLVAANAMAMSMRERTTEIAVLKAIGFPRARVMRMILGESCMIALLGGVLGIAIGCGFLELGHRANPQMFAFSVASLVGAWMLVLLAVAAGIGFVSGIVPSVRAAQLSVVDGLRRVV